MKKHFISIVLLCAGVLLSLSCNSGEDSGSGDQGCTLTLIFTNATTAGYSSSSKSTIIIRENSSGAVWVQTAGIKEPLTLSGSTYTTTAKEYILAGNVYTTTVKHFAAGTSVDFNIFLDKNGDGVQDSGEINDGIQPSIVIHTDTTVTFDCLTLHKI
jgi:hypothetical protein